MLARAKGALLFIGMVFAAMIIINFTVRNFAAHHADNAAAQALAQLV